MSFISFKIRPFGTIDVIDSAFEETRDGNFFRYDEIILTIMGIYKKKNLDVARNIFLLYKWLIIENKKYDHNYFIMHIVNSEEFKEYRQDFEKYLVLL